VDVANVADVQQVEAAVGQDDLLAQLAPLFDPVAKFLTRDDFVRMLAHSALRVLDRVD
jgi:hypothetical protein